MSPLAARKQLLIAESELNRAQLAGELAQARRNARALADRARMIGTIASAAAALVAGLSAMRGRKAEAPAGKLSWLKKALRVAGFVSSFWLAFRSQESAEKEE